MSWLSDRVDDVGDAIDHTVDAGTDLAGDVIKGGIDLAGDVVQFQVDAAGNVLDAAGHVVKAEINAAGQVIDAAGNVIGAAKDYVTSPFALLGPFGLPAYGLSKLFGGDDGPSKAEQIAGLGEGQPNADVILDLASDCEKLFSVWRPRMEAAGLNPTTTFDQAAAMFDRERGMSFATLRADAQHLLDGMGQLSEASSAQRAEAQALASTWQGEGGTATQTYLTTFQSTCGSVVADTFSGAVSLNGCADKLEQAVKDKAQALLPLYQESIGGKSPGDVDMVIAASKLDGDSWMETVGGLLGFTFFGPLSLLTDYFFDKLKHEIAEAARGWLHDVFAPGYNQAASSFVSICDATSDSVREIYGVAASGFDDVDPAAFAPLSTGIPDPAPATPPPAPEKQDPVPQSPGGGDQGGTGGGGGGTPGDGGGGGGMPPGGGGGGMPPGGGGGSITPGGGGGGGGITPATPTTSQGIEDILGGTGTGTPPTSVPAGLPPGAGWVSDPSDLPKGWTIDPDTGQLLPPGAPGSKGDPEVHSAAADELLDGDGKGDLGGAGTPGAGSATGSAPSGAGVQDVLAGGGTDPAGTLGATPPDAVSGQVITVSDDGVQLQISADDTGGAGAHIQVTDATGEVSGYRVEIGPDGAPQLVPDEAAPTTSAGAPSAQQVLSEPSSSTGGAPTTAAAGPAFEARGGDAPTAGGAVGGGAQTSGAQAAPWDGGATSGGTAQAAPVASGEPVAAPVHSAAVTGTSWADPQGAPHDGSGASLASARTSSTGAHAGSGAVLAGADGGVGTGGATTGGAGGMAGMGGAGAAGGGGESQEHRASQQWRVLDDTFAEDASSWASLGDVLTKGEKADEGQVDR